jgi:hypothetical protein
MNMIDQYVFEVGENLPEKQRADLEKEIRSLIEDTLEGRSKSTGKAIDDDMIVEVLKEFGSPAKMAASYLPARYLIGPQLYPTFILVLKIVAAVMLVLALVGLGVDAAQGIHTYRTVFDLIIHSAGSLFQSLLVALGNIVFIFAIIERFVPQGIEKEKEWDPRSMKPVEEPDKVSRFEQIWIILWSAVAVLLFNFYPQLLRFVFLQDGKWYAFSFLSDTFFTYVPALTILWMLEIFLCILLFMNGAWQTGTRWFKVALKALNIVLLAVIIAGPPILKFAIEGFPVLPGVLKNLVDAFPAAYNGFRALLVVVVVIECIELGKAVYRGITRKQIKLFKS